MPFWGHFLTFPKRLNVHLGLTKVSSVPLYSPQTTTCCNFQELNIQYFDAFALQLTDRKCYEL